MQPDHYTYRVTWSPEDQEHVGLCTEFPSLSWLATTPEEALSGIRQLAMAAAEQGVSLNRLASAKLAGEKVAWDPRPGTGMRSSPKP
jgi:hypothetical protein